MEVTTLTKSSKRAKSRGITVAHCSVDGCNSDLSRCREYHRRHKVCEAHSKTPRVTICGREQRFCQQCSRFHSLIEFDEGKRSCRKRLDGHNRRRRKPQLESFTRNHGLLFSSQQDARLLSFSDPESFDVTIGSSSWAEIINPDKDLKACPKQSGQDYILNQNSCNEASSYNYNVANQIQFVQSTEFVHPDVSTRQLLHDPNCSPANGNCSQRRFSDGLSPLIDSDRALSLLSSGSAVTRDICFDHLVQPAQSSMYHHHQHSQPLAHDDLHFSRLGQFSFSESKPIVSATTTESSKVSNSSNFPFQEAFHNGLNELSTSGSQQTVTFMWE